MHLWSLIQRYTKMRTYRPRRILPVTSMLLVISWGIRHWLGDIGGVAPPEDFIYRNHVLVNGVSCRWYSHTTGFSYIFSYYIGILYENVKQSLSDIISTNPFWESPSRNDRSSPSGVFENFLPVLQELVLKKMRCQDHVDPRGGKWCWLGILNWLIVKYYKIL